MKKILTLAAILTLVGCSGNIHYEVIGEVSPSAPEGMETVSCYNWNTGEEVEIPIQDGKFVIEGVVKEPTVFTGSQNGKAPYFFIAERPGKIKLQLVRDGSALPTGTPMNNAVSKFWASIMGGHYFGSLEKNLQSFLYDNQNLAGAYAICLFEMRNMISRETALSMAEEQCPLIKDFVTKAYAGL